jgi:hypothetical protein
MENKTGLWSYRWSTLQPSFNPSLKREQETMSRFFLRPNGHDRKKKEKKGKKKKKKVTLPEAPALNIEPAYKDLGTSRFHFLPIQP